MGALKRKRLFHVDPTITYMPKVSNRSMNNNSSLLKVSYKETRTIFLLLTFNRFHTRFWESKNDWEATY